MGIPFASYGMNKNKIYANDYPLYTNYQKARKRDTRSNKS